MIKILANDGIDPIGKKMLEDAGFEVDTNNIPQDELPVKLQAYDAITVRSATKVRKALIDACPNLKLIGRGGVGVDNIDVEYAKEKGIGVYNTPASSSLSVAELVFGQLFGCVRFLHDSNRKMPVDGNTKFNDLKKAYAKGIELRGKTLGIVGFGRIGREFWRPHEGHVGTPFASHLRDFRVVSGNDRTLDCSGAHQGITGLDRPCDQRFPAQVDQVLPRDAFRAPAGGNDGQNGLGAHAGTPIERDGLFSRRPSRGGSHALTLSK